MLNQKNGYRKQRAPRDLDTRALDSINLHDDLVRHGALDPGEKHFNQYPYHKHVEWIEGIEDVNGGGGSGFLRSLAN